MHVCVDDVQRLAWSTSEEVEEAVVHAPQGGMQDKRKLVVSKSMFRRASVASVGVPSTWEFTGDS